MDGISIHAAREGGDFADAFCEPIYVISIHAAREGGDARLRGRGFRSLYFNPRRP